MAVATNLSQAKARGVRDMASHKRGGLGIEDMVKSRWVYRKLRNFRAGIEAGISCLKRAYGPQTPSVGPRPHATRSEEQGFMDGH
jgi:IS5 family transposase